MRIPIATIVLACAAASGQSSLAQESAAPARRSAQPIKSPAYYDIGGYHRKASTDSPVAQVWFDRGLAMCFGFNHDEAVRCFQKALDADPGMAMAHWGIAYAWGPNINNMEIAPHQIAQAEWSLRLAKRFAAHDGTDLERQLIDALAARYAAPVPEDREPLNRAYATAMKSIYAQQPKDALVATLYAESLMNLQPWKHWSPAGEPAEHTAEITKVLESALKQAPNHPALCHLYIHTLEASPHPEEALPAANRLRQAMPGVGHLVHMPSHIDVLVGDYPNVIKANRMAILADNEFARREGKMNFYSLYRIHNYHFLVYGAMFDGQSDLALKTARAIPNQVPEEMLRAQVDFLDAFMPTAIHVMVRFGRWETILKEPKPADYLPVSQSIWHYARGLAFAATERVEDAKREQVAFRRIRASVPETSFLFQNSSDSILGVAEAMLAGEIAYREGKLDQAFQHLREAVRRDDGLNYDEPWGWMQPTRHALAALLLEQGHYANAEKVYRADLRRRPKNPWSLHGLAECLARQGRTDESQAIHAQFLKASERSDIKIDRSCFCRIGKRKAKP